MVIVPEAISEWIRKGEVTDRYYNPGDLFRTVHLVLCNDDRPDPAIVQRLVGCARLHIHNAPRPPKFFLRTLGMRPALMKGWAEQIVALARQVRPQLVRCHGALFNAYAALRIQQTLGVPYAISLHINPDEDVRGREHDWKNRLYNQLTQGVERLSLRNADMVMPVYQPILPYLQRIGAPNVKVHYNVLNGRFLRPKEVYTLHCPARLIYVGRLFDLKDPTPIIDAIADLPDVVLTIVGDGPLRPALEAHAKGLGLSKRVIFRPAVPNDELCSLLAESDLFVVHTEHWEISKSVLEALLTGLPIVINRRRGAPVPELTPDIVCLVDTSADAYRSAIRDLLEDDAARAALGRAALAAARAGWAPAVTEAAVVETYRALMQRAGTA